MYEKKLPELLDCGLAVSLKVIGGKWRAWVIDCINRGIRRPSAIHREMQGIAPRIINVHLKELEEQGIIYKKIYAASPAHVAYLLTETGESVLPVLQALEDWGNKHKGHIYRNNPAFREKSCAFLPEQEATN